MLNTERLESLREERYASEEDFGKAIGVSERTYKRWLKGETVPDINFTLKMALLLETTVAYLVNETEEAKRVVLVADLSGSRKANIEAIREGVDPELVKKAVAFLAGLSND